MYGRIDAGDRRLLRILRVLAGFLEPQRVEQVIRRFPVRLNLHGEPRQSLGALASRKIEREQSLRVATVRLQRERPIPGNHAAHGGSLLPFDAGYVFTRFKVSDFGRGFYRCSRAAKEHLIGTIAGSDYAESQRSPS